MKSLNQKFIEEISKIKEPEVFIGIGKILKVEFLDSEGNIKNFGELFKDVMEKFDKENRSRRRELFKILRAANQASMSEADNAD